MIIEILEQKYKCGCKRGIGMIKQPCLLTRFNIILEWKYCSFPKEIDQDKLPKDDEGNTVMPEELTPDMYREKRDFLGEQPELKPGDMFLFHGQIVAVDSEEMFVLVLSETGSNALGRIWEEHIEPEIDMIYNDYEINNVVWEDVSKSEIPGTYEITTPAYKLYKIWKEHFIAGRFEDNDDLCIKCEVDDDELLLPVTIYMNKWNVGYDPADYVNEDQAKEIIQHVISWFYENEDRKEYNPPKEKED
jgi:hypothetical protein